MADQLDDVRAALGDRFRVDREIGAGGMAVVYLARELATDSSVAIKVLRDALSAVIGRARFVREISIASQLDHPRIVRVLSSGEAGGVLYAVMPYVAGETLRHRLASQKQLPIADAVALACEVAEALAYAHDKGFIHRDIKPANILLSEHGAVVTDFGIARAISSSTDEDTMTTSGIVIGTPMYMAPEQAARDRDLDGRSDIYALGTVLYEMLVGDVPFPGLTSWNALARMATQPPIPPRSLRPSIPVALERVVMRSLERTPADRYHTALEFRDAMLDALRAPSMSARGWRRIGSATVTVAAVVGAAWIVRPPRSADPPPASRLEITPPAGVQFSNNLRDVSAVSPDGQDIVIPGIDSAGTPSLWLRNLATGVITRIPHTDGGSMAFWSPNGKQIGVFRRGSITVVGKDGNNSQQLAAVTTEARGGSWADNGTIFYAPNSQRGIFTTSLAARASRQLTTPSTTRGEIGHMWPQALPGGRKFLYFVASDADSVRGIYLASVDLPSNGRRLVESSASAVFSKGYLLYVHEGKLVAQRLNPSTASLEGERQVIADSVATSYDYYGVFSASDSASDVLVFVGGRSRDNSQLVWRDSTGANKGFASDKAYMRNPILSASGRYLAYEAFRGTDSDIRYQDLTTGVTATISDGGLQATDPVWSSDASSLAFAAERPGGWTIFRTYLGRNAEAEPLLTLSQDIVLLDWSKGDEYLVLAERSKTGDYDLIARKLDNLREPIVLARGSGQQLGARVSPDGKHVAYVSTESGQPQVYVQSFPKAASHCQVSAGGGYQVAWGKTPGVLYFLSSSGMMMQATLKLDATSRCLVAPPRQLFPTDVRGASTARSFFDVSLESGQLLVHSPSVGEGAFLSVITNWLAAARLKP